MLLAYFCHSFVAPRLKWKLIWFDSEKDWYRLQLPGAVQLASDMKKRRRIIGQSFIHSLVIVAIVAHIGYNY